MHILSFEALSTFLLWDVADNIGTYLLLLFPRLSPQVTTVSPLSVPNNSPSPLYSSFHLKIRRIVLFVICSPNAGTLVLALSIPNIVKHGLLHYMSVIVDKVTWWAGVDMGNSACIHHSTLQLQQSAVTMLLILTAGGGEMYRVATLLGVGSCFLPLPWAHW